MYIAAIRMVIFPLCCMPKWHAHPTRHVEELGIVMIWVPSDFVLNRQVSILITVTVFTPKVNELPIEDTHLHKFSQASI